MLLQLFLFAFVLARLLTGATFSFYTPKTKREERCFDAVVWHTDVLTDRYAGAGV